MKNRARRALIPHVAKQTEKEVRFVIIGLIQDQKVYGSLTRSVKKLGLTEKVKIMPNAPKKELEDVLR